MSGDSHRNRAKRARLFKRQNGLCFWCKKPMRLLDLAGVSKLKKQPPDMCTLDHLEPRWHPQRGEFSGFFRIVAACAKCNHERDRQQCAQIPRESLRAASEQGLRAAELARQFEGQLAAAFPIIDKPKERVFTFEPEHLPHGPMAGVVRR